LGGDLHLLGDLEAIALEPDDVPRARGEQPNPFQPQVPEDLRADAQHDPDDDPDFDGEELISERTLDPLAVATPTAPPRSSHLKPVATGKSGDTPNVPRTNGNGKVNGNGHTNGNGASAVQADGYQAMAGSQAERIRVARQKGYEGDPCANCQAMTLVRSGACLRCDTCGATTGCG
jgi:ribonucleoside-diphosphate reductase alpha chain